MKTKPAELYLLQDKAPSPPSTKLIFYDTIEESRIELAELNKKARLSARSVRSTNRHFLEMPYDKKNDHFCPGEIRESRGVFYHNLRNTILNSLRRIRSYSDLHCGHFAIEDDIFVFGFQYWDNATHSIRVDPYHETDIYRVLLVLTANELLDDLALLGEFRSRGLRLPRCDSL